MKIALIHDWFNDIGGSEKVVQEILLCYPEADVFCLMDFYSEENRKKYLAGKSSTTSFLQHLPFIKKFYRFFFPLFPRAIESLDVSAYDLLISSSSSVSKGVKKHAKQIHICYCHSPMRYAWDLREEYLKVTNNAFSRWVLNFFFERLKRWDEGTCDRVDYFIANSKNVADRIQRNYSRESVVIYPPVNIEKFSFNSHKQNYYFTVSRMVSYKMTEQIIQAFTAFPHLKLIVAGTGPIAEKLKKLAGKNVEMLGYISSADLVERIRNAKAFIVNANEDFGITVVEAQACATPIIAPYLGGYKETVTEKTGLFFKSQQAVDIQEAIKLFELHTHEFLENDFKENIQKFNKQRFQKEFRSFVEECCQNHKVN